LAILINNKENATSYFSSFFENLKQELIGQLSNKNDDQLSYQKLALKDAIFSLPCPVSIVRIKVNANIYENTESESYYLIKYDLSNYGKFQIDFYGEIEIDKINRNVNFADVFSLNNIIIESLKELRLVTYGDTEWPWYWFVSQKTLVNTKRYIRDFLLFYEFNFKDKIVRLFGKEIEYNVKYNLEPDEILDQSNLLSIDKTVKTLFKAKNTEKLLEKLQRDICGFQLSPNIPKEVRKVFNAAKKLYVFGYFDYYFFTISQHYTFLAVESALRNKHISIFGESPKFINLKNIIRTLVENKIIREAEHCYYHSVHGLRNSLSHLTQPTILMPNPVTLERASFLINQLYEENECKNS